LPWLAQADCPGDSVVEVVEVDVVEVVRDPTLLVGFGCDFA
jgi:hypothetical protein